MSYTSIPGRTIEGNYGKRSNPRTLKTDAALTVSCPACGALRDSDCRTIRGERLSSTVHTVRSRKAKIARTK